MIEYFRGKTVELPCKASESCFIWHLVVSCFLVAISPHMSLYALLPSPVHLRPQDTALRPGGPGADVRPPLPRELIVQAEAQLATCVPT